jgi:hypothetical protein
MIVPPVAARTLRRATRRPARRSVTVKPPGWGAQAVTITFGPRVRRRGRKRQAGAVVHTGCRPPRRMRRSRGGPVARATYRSPSRSKAIRRPSGDHDGWASGPPVSTRTGAAVAAS